MPIDPNTGLITQNGTREEIDRAERDRRRIIEGQEKTLAGLPQGYPRVGGSPTAGLDMPASGPFRAFITLIVLAMLAYVIPSSWRWVMSMWQQGRIIELVAGFVLVFMACMAVIAVIVAIWQFFARGGLIKLAILATCGWFAWKVLIPHPVYKPAAVPIASPAHPHHKR